MRNASTTSLVTLTTLALALAAVYPSVAQQPPAAQKPAVEQKPSAEQKPAAAPQAAGTKNLKIQSSWPASLTLQDNLRFFAERVDKLTGGQVKIEALAGGQVVPPFEVLDAASKKVIDGAQPVS